jgi:hypothetical protein
MNGWSIQPIKIAMHLPRHWVEFADVCPGDNRSPARLLA